jgi:hypothetical protein
MPWQTPPMQLLLQQSENVPHMPPSGVHASTQAPPLHVPLQQSAPTMQTAPFGLQVPQSAPQNCSASATQEASQPLWQQEGSAMQTLFTHAPHCGPSGAPVTQMSCAHGGCPPHWPFALH